MRHSSALVMIIGSIKDHRTIKSNRSYIVHYTSRTIKSKLIDVLFVNSYHTNIEIERVTSLLQPNHWTKWLRSSLAHSNTLMWILSVWNSCLFRLSVSPTCVRDILMISGYWTCQFLQFIEHSRKVWSRRHRATREKFFYRVSSIRSQSTDWIPIKDLNGEVRIDNAYCEIGSHRWSNEQWGMTYQYLIDGNILRSTPAIHLSLHLNYVHVEKYVSIATSLQSIWSPFSLIK